MMVIRLDGVELERQWDANDTFNDFEVAYPLFAGNGAEQMTVFYWVIQSGCLVGFHTDSAEEVLLVVTGKIAVSDGAEVVTVTEGQLLYLPRLTTHELRNVGEKEARCLSFLPSSNVAVWFAAPLQPWGLQYIRTGDLPLAQAPQGKESAVYTPTMGSPSS